HSQPPDPVGAVAVPPPDRAEAAAEGVGDGAHAGGRPAQGSQPERRARRQDRRPGGARADGGGAAGRGPRARPHPARTGARVAPAPMVAVRRAGSTVTADIARVSMSTPPSTPGIGPWPVART